VKTARRAFPRSGVLFLLAYAPIVIPSAFAQRRPAAKEPSSVSWKAPREGQPSDYAGVETCAACHHVRVLQVAKTPHAHVGMTGVAVDASCEACHGPGRAHVEAEREAEQDRSKKEAARRLIFNFQASPRDNAARCLRCHVTGQRQEFFSESQHLGVGVACNSCHSPHPPEIAQAPNQERSQLAQAKFFSVPQLPAEERWRSESLLKQTQPDLCFSCHATIRARFSLPFHHRVPEGLMKCTDCHNPHSSMNHASLAKPNWETCVGCHVEKRGPFVFEHPVVRVEGCVRCHNPHGSVTRFMLVRREVRFMCMQCHGDPNSVATSVPHSRLGFQARGECTRCHVAIHGSNFDEVFLH